MAGIGKMAGAPRVDEKGSVIFGFVMAGVASVALAISVAGAMLWDIPASEQEPPSSLSMEGGEEEVGARLRAETGIPYVASFEQHAVVGRPGLEVFVEN